MKTFLFLYGFGIAVGFGFLNTKTGARLHENAKKEHGCWKSCVTDGHSLSGCFNVCEGEPSDANRLATDDISAEEQAGLNAKLEAIFAGVDK